MGYKDEHYFSRVFKKSEGVAPAGYLKNNHIRIAVLYYGLDDYLMTLGLMPVAALSYRERVSRNYSLPHSGILEQDIVRLNGSRLNYEELARLKPDLIIGSDRLLPGELLESIAPTVVLKHTDNVEQQLSRLSRILGREQQADDWMNRYAEQKHLLRSQLEAQDVRPTVSFIRVSSEFYRLYGASNQTGTLLYQDLGLSPPPQPVSRLKQWISRFMSFPGITREPSFWLRTLPWNRDNGWKHCSRPENGLPWMQ